MSYHLTPLEVCERLIGSPPELAAICLLDPKSAFPWRRASKWREAGDFPSARVQRALLSHSASHGLGLTAEHLIWGAPASEIEAILAARGGASAPVAPGFRSIRAEPNGVAA